MDYCPAFPLCLLGFQRDERLLARVLFPSWTAGKVPCRNIFKLISDHLKSVCPSQGTATVSLKITWILFSAHKIMFALQFFPWSGSVSNSWSTCCLPWSFVAGVFCLELHVNSSDHSFWEPACQAASHPGISPAFTLRKTQLDGTAFKKLIFLALKNNKFLLILNLLLF